MATARNFAVAFLFSGRLPTGFRFNDAALQANKSNTKPLNRQGAKDARVLLLLKAGFKLSFATFAPSR